MGIDESGRGPVIGPMVICGLVVNDDQERELAELGVKDSKLLDPDKREKLSRRIEEISTHVIIIRIPAHKIDANRLKFINLNQIEAIKMAEIIDMAKPNKVVIDLPGHNSHKFTDYIFSKLEYKDVEIVAENYADKNYPVVSAASIMAKVDRDEQIRRLEKEVGEPLGVGYPHDEITINHLKKLIDDGKARQMPRYVRTTWDTTRQLIKKYEQKKIFGFVKT